MSRISPILLGMSLAVAGGAVAAAQDSATTPAKILEIQREWIKPGKTGAVHDKSESAFVAAAAKAKLGHYMALNSLSGKSRALFMLRYPSFEAMEKENNAIGKNAAVAAEFDRDTVADGELLEGFDTTVFTYDAELSYHPRPDLSHARYYQLSVFHVRPGHMREWRQVVKMYQDACDKAAPDAHWGMYEIAYGGESGTYISLSHRASLKEMDDIMAGGKKFFEAMGGEEGMQKFDELFGQAVDSSRNELFSINPKQSYAEEAWIKADPDFWKPKAKAAEASAAKPAPAAPAPKPSSR